MMNRFSVYCLMNLKNESEANPARFFALFGVKIANFPGCYDS